MTKEDFLRHHCREGVGMTSHNETDEAIERAYAAVSYLITIAARSGDKGAIRGGLQAKYALMQIRGAEAVEAEECGKGIA